MLLFIKKIKLILICCNFVYFIRMFTFKTRQEHAWKMKNNLKVSLFLGLKNNAF